MRFSLALLSALVIPAVLSASLPVADEYDELYKACKDAGPDAFAAIQRENNPVEIFKYSNCYETRSTGGGKMKFAVVCRPASCYTYASGTCQGPLLPAPATLTPPMFFPASDVWVESVLGSAGSCQPSGLSDKL